MIEVGRICVKIAGRDAGKKCVVVDILDKGYALIDGQTRRRKCNILHLEPLDITVKLDKNANHESVVSALKAIKLDVTETKKKETSDRPRKVRKEKKKAAEEEKKAGKGKKKEKPKEKKVEVKEAAKSDKK